MKNFLLILYFLPLFIFAQENNPLLCSDGIDNDGDGLIDCDDTECMNLSNNGCSTCFLDGISFADEVLSYNNTCSLNSHTNPYSALGVSDYTAVPNDEYVSLGKGGSISLGFVNNILVNSGDNSPDVWVFEVGPVVEDSQIDLRPADQSTIDILLLSGIKDVNSDGYYEFAIISGSTSSLDIDKYVIGYAYSALKFDAIKITDAIGGCTGDTPGSDIDAVCALSSVFVDCMGVENGNSLIDDCGLCLELNDPNFNQSCKDCNGVINGNAVEDICGICLDPQDPNFNLSCLDCNGTIDGTAVLDNCELCLEINDPLFNQTCFDCAGIVNGISVIDVCGLCLKPNDPIFNLSCLDCSGTPHGIAVLDDCGLCLEPDDIYFNETCKKRSTFIPNIFSPNNDGVNEKFEVFIQTNTSAVLLKYAIYDRWGNLVYLLIDKKFDDSIDWWNGRSNNREANEGIYTYYIEIEFLSGIISYIGDITLVR